MRWFMLPMLVVAVGCSSSSTPVNNLQDAVNSILVAGAAPGRIVDEEIRGDWAWARTEKDGVVGNGTFVLMKSEGGPKWYALNFILYRIEGSSLKLLGGHFGGDLVRKKGEGMPENVKKELESKWDTYLKAKDYSIQK